MDLKDIIKKIEDLSAADIVDQICEKEMSFKAFSEAVKDAGGWPSADKRTKVKSLYNQKDDEAYKVASSAYTVKAFEKYLSAFPDGNNDNEAKLKIKEIRSKENEKIRIQQDREDMLYRIKEDINEYTVDEIQKKISPEEFDNLCHELGIDPQIINNFTPPLLNFNHIPQSESDIPNGYTDVFFWGIPSSGKTCALSAILSTVKKDYTMEAPDIDRKFGATYRDSLVNIFINKDYGYLPGRTVLDRTQYMPFLLSKRREGKKRKISFFELSGEVFKHFYEVYTDSKIIDEDKREDIEKSFQTLELLLKSKNQKIHFFFIDYNKETKKTKDTKTDRTQGDYLEAAANYFRDNDEIFKKRTDAVYVIITKADEIKSNDKSASGRSFLSENFGSFMDVLQNQCNEHSVTFKVKLFSIGDVYFKNICKINRSYSRAVIDDLLDRVKPSDDNVFGRFLRK